MAQRSNIRSDRVSPSEESPMLKMRVRGQSNVVTPLDVYPIRLCHRTALKDMLTSAEVNITLRSHLELLCCFMEALDYS